MEGVEFVGAEVDAGALGDFPDGAVQGFVRGGLRCGSQGYAAEQERILKEAYEQLAALSGQA